MTEQQTLHAHLHTLECMNTIIDATKHIDPVSFYVDISWNDPSHNTLFTDLMDEYFARYAVGKEKSQKTKREHYQVFAIGLKSTSYNSFIAKLKKEFPHLVGKAQKGKRRNYGRIKDKIKDPENMISYVLKDGNFFTKDYDENYIAERYDASYQKPDDSEINKYERFVLQILPMIHGELKQCLDECYNQRDWTDFQPFFHKLTTAIVKEWRTEFHTLISKTTYKKLLYDLGILNPKYYAETLMRDIFPRDLTEKFRPFGM